MTLDTTVLLHEWTNPLELHSWFNREVLKVADRDPIIRRDDTSIRNALGQGFDAIFEVEWGKNDGPYVWFDRAEREAAIAKHVPGIYTAEEAATEIDEDEKFYAEYPNGFIKINWDTAYGYRGEHGEGCSALHANFIVGLATEYLEPRGIGFHWQNEYSGEWNEGLTGFEEFLGDGADAFKWFAGTALPAILASAAEETDA